MLLFNCQDNFLDEEITKEKIEEKVVTAKGKSKKKIKYRGHLVDHRFKSSEKELKEKHTKKYLKKLYNKLRKKTRGKEVAGKENEVELPGQEAIFEATKVVIQQFPYPEIEGFVLLNKPEKDIVDVTLIQQDFSTMSLTDIENNIETIDAYYSQNLDYAVLDEIAQHPEIYDSMNRTSETIIYTFTMAQVMANGFGLIRGSIAYGLAGPNSTTSSENYYPNVDKYNTREDAYRHILWNALLAQYYWSVIPSKVNRMEFANIVASSREIISPNTIDGTAMDLHNNLIGRNVWSAATTYETVAGITIGLNLSSTSHLKDVIHEKVEKHACYIVKEDKRDDDIYDFSAEEVKIKILATASYSPVYFEGEMAPKWTLNYITLDYSDCKDGNGLLQPKNNSKVNEITQSLEAGNRVGNDCVKTIHHTDIITPCFKSKDSNYNPYN